ncbi:MAG: PilZ domain-containing protein [Bdellovibrionaceae bacterium]|nr:PilZ domain-containing protein [Pseudobdellovibrionaceae bacterium]NUM57548.1 PilZ domain-containing protein [Pseudobdellovibrionaceae bacterium]
MDSSEQVPAPRTPLLLPVSFKKNYSREDAKGNLRNISLTGAFLEHTQEVFKSHEKIVIYLQVAGRERKLSATVIWSNSVGCGIKFNPTNNRDVQIIDDLIYFVETQRSDRRSVIDKIFKKVG